MSTALKEPKMASAPQTTTPSPADDSSLWDRIGDFFGGVSEGINGTLGKLFGSSNERTVRAFGFLRTKEQDPPYRLVPRSGLRQINQVVAKMRELTAEGLRELTP